MSNNKNLVQQFKNWALGNPIVAVVIILAIILGATNDFLGEAKKLWKTIFPEKTKDEFYLESVKLELDSLLNYYAVTNLATIEDPREIYTIHNQLEKISNNFGLMESSFEKEAKLELQNRFVDLKNKILDITFQLIESYEATLKLGRDAKKIKTAILINSEAFLILCNIDGIPCSESEISTVQNTISML